MTVSRVSRFGTKLQRIVQRRWWMFRSIFRRERIRVHLRERSAAASRFQAYPSVLLALQVFNKDFLLSRALRPFLDVGLRHVVVFADGCCDCSAPIAHRLLPGLDHFVIAANDRHEVRNNRVALDLARSQGCEFLLLLQDDDLYPPSLRWLDYAIKLFRDDPKLLVIGFNVGLDFLELRHAPDHYLSNPLRSRTDIHPDAVGVDDTFLAIRHGLPPHPDHLQHRYCQVVCRAPLLIRIHPFLEQGGIDPRFIPFQDDDTYFCLRTWSLGYRCALVRGLPVRRDMGIGGMRLMGHITTTRAAHTLRNIRVVHTDFGDAINNGSIQRSVDIANRELGLSE